MSDNSEFEEKPGICHCGSVHEAITAGENMFIQLAGTDCPVWAMQVAFITLQIAMRQLTRGTGLAPTDLVETQVFLGKGFVALGRPHEDLMKEAAEKFFGLHGYYPGDYTPGAVH